LAESPGDGTVPAFSSWHSMFTTDHERTINTEASAPNHMDSNEPLLTRGELEDLHAKYREMKQAS
jgi:hypothetical protein